MHSDPHRLAEMADPVLNRHFSRRWSERPLTARDLEHLANIEMAQGNLRRADALSWQAHLARVDQQATGAAS